MTLSDVTIGQGLKKEHRQDQTILARRANCLTTITCIAFCKVIVTLSNCFKTVIYVAQGRIVCDTKSIIYIIYLFKQQKK